MAQEEFKAFVRRNPNLQIIDLNLDHNQVANSILLQNTNLQIVRLRCSNRGERQRRLVMGPCKKLRFYSWFRNQPNLKYLWLECDFSSSIDQLLESLPVLKDLRILRLEEAQGFKEKDFHKILEILPSLEVRLLTSNLKKEFYKSDI